MVKDINFNDFSKIDIRVGSIIEAHLNKDSIKPCLSYTSDAADE